MSEYEKYPDLLANAVQNPTEEASLLLNPTDHGWLNDADFKTLVDRRVKLLLKSQVYSKTYPNGEIWQVFPEGTKRMHFDRFGNQVDGERIPQ
ncbi:hypothetical protein [Tatumella terrea]|uniref:Uncharacterized protein n=1 Tax=Tatumella terrea TaxID=419007 RepID=A0ABW1VZY0_9GAMM